MKKYTFTAFVVANADGVIISKAIEGSLPTCQSKLKTCKDIFGMSLLNASISDGKNILFSSKNRIEDAEAYVRGWDRGYEWSRDTLNGVLA